MAEWGQVKRIMERTRLTERGDLERVYRVEAVTAKGTSFTMDLTEAESEPKKANQLLAAKAAKLDALLGG